LLAAAKAEELWLRALKDPNFEKQIMRPLVVDLPDFSIGANVLLSRIEKHLPLSRSI
jgi:hypothetical protein